jgi:hypothetical protein
LEKYIIGVKYIQEYIYGVSEREREGERERARNSERESLMEKCGREKSVALLGVAGWNLRIGCI